MFVEQRPYVEAYELLRTRDGETLRFGEFLQALRSTYDAMTSGPDRRVVSELAPPIPPTTASLDSWSDDPAVRAEQRSMLKAALASLAEDDRLAVQLYIVDEMPADQVARALGYANAKTVYNRVYRALAAIRARLAQAGMKREDV
jgi:DNA-directed RNA polymerase specialized sigma24 family protein